MNFTFVASICATALFGGMLLLFEVGRRIGTRRLAIDPDGIAKGSGPVEAAIFGLLGLLLAFTFSGAASRFEQRRHLIGEEANAIGTAYLRVALLPPNAQPEMRLLFSRYVDSRLEAYRNVADATATRARLSRSAMLQNQMIDITTTRAVAMQNHPPRVIFFPLTGLSLVCSALVGYVTCGTIVRSWFYMLLVATTMSLTLYVILELEFPRLGAIRIDAADQTLVELRNTM